jgi:hypothetical protein
MDSGDFIKKNFFEIFNRNGADGCVRSAQASGFKTGESWIPPARPTVASRRHPAKWRIINDKTVNLQPQSRQ